MAYTAKDAITAFYSYMGISENQVKIIPGTDNRGIVLNLATEQCVIFIYPIGHKTDDSKNYFDTRDSGGTYRIEAFNFALANKLKFFVLGIHNQVDKYKNYFFSLECSEDKIQEIDGTKMGRRNGTGTQIVIPNTFVPVKKFDRIITKLGVYISVIHKDCILNYLETFDNRPYLNTIIENNTKEIITIIPLSTTANECAHQIIQKIYSYDKFARMTALFRLNKNIKIDTNEICPEDVLYNVFYTVGSVQFNDKKRTFINEEYLITLKENLSIPCRLTNQWCGFGKPDGDIDSNRNYLWALRDIINIHYDGIFKIENDGANAKLICYEQESKTFEPKSIEELKSSFNVTFYTGNDTFPLRYITSLLAKPFVILSGNSGTGKTKIARDFAHWLGKYFNEETETVNILLLPVGADWTDNTKILGYYNPIDKVYVKTPVLELIERANDNPDIPFFLILDEMNLSHVERYFSDFLSLMETPDEQLKLDHYGKGFLKFPKNLFVTGTVNIDETTYMFSPKVLDRANVIEFKPEKDDVLKLMEQDSDLKEIASANDGSAEAFLQLAEKVRESNISEYSEINFETAKNLLNQIYDCLKKTDLEFAFRTVKEIRQYIIASYELCEDKTKFNFDSCLDEQIVQKILPKIHGNKKQIGSLLDELENIFNIDKYPLSNAKLVQMKDRLLKMQYTSFI